MNITKLSTIAAALLIAFASCKKDKNETPEPEPANNYPFLKVGNYVVYETVSIDSFGVAKVLQLDSSIIEKDTIIGGHTFFKKVNTNILFMPAVEYLRDSSGFLVSSDGKKLSGGPKQPYKHAEIINGDTVYEIHVFEKPNDTTLTVPAGTFKVKTTVNRTIEHIKDSVKIYFNADFYSFINEQYGITISRQYGYMYQYRLEKSYFEERLVRYKID